MGHMRSLVWLRWSAVEKTTTSRNSYIVIFNDPPDTYQDLTIPFQMSAHLPPAMPSSVWPLLSLPGHVLGSTASQRPSGLVYANQA